MRISDWSSDVCSSDLTPPAIVKRLRIFGDNDPKYGGQAAAYALAHRMSVRLDCVECSVEIPNQTGMAWADRRDARSEERRVGEGCVRQCSYRGSPYS